MRLGEKGILSLEQWLEQEAAAVRDDAETSAASAAAAVSEPKQREDAMGPRHETAASDAISSSSSAATIAAAADAGGGEVPSAINGSGKDSTNVGGFRLGVDPWLLSAGTARSLTTKLVESGGGLMPISG